MSPFNSIYLTLISFLIIVTGIAMICFQTCDMDKRNDSDVRDVVLWKKQCSDYFVIVFSNDKFFVTL